MNSSIVTEPYWWEDAPPFSVTIEEWRNTVDVVIIGGGFTGFGAALPLARAGLNVVVIEKDKIGAAASARNGGITSGNLRLSFNALLKKFGVEKATKFYQEAHAARQDLINFITSEKLDCDLQLCGRFVGALRPQSLESMRQDAEVLNQLTGVEPTVCDRASIETYIESNKYCGGVWREDIAGIHPAKLLAEMYRLAVVAGTIVFSGVAVTSVSCNKSGKELSFQIETKHGSVKAGHVITATNAYGDKSLPWVRRRLVPVISEMIATEELGKNLVSSLMPSKSMYGEALKLGYYYRPSPDGKRILLGGRRMDSNQIKAAAQLKAGLASIFPDLAECNITHHWSGFVAFPFDQLPKLAVHDGVIYPVGYCGSGTVWARWLGQKAAMMVLGDLDDSVFSGLPFRTMPFYSGEPWFLPLAMKIYAFQDKFTTTTK